MEIDLDNSLASALKFRQSRNSQSGPLFIVASGPSAKDFPFEKYRKYPMFAVSGSIQLLMPSGIRPFFYLCDDNSFATQRHEILAEAIECAERVALSPRVITITKEKSPGILDDKNLHQLARVNRAAATAALSDRQFAWHTRNDPDIERRFSLFRKKPNRIGFSRNMEKGYYSCRTIPYAGLQLAYHLGFQTVFLVGVDLNSSKGRFYEAGASAMPSHLDEDYEDYILPCFKLMSDKVVSERFRVFNLSMDSRLPSSVVPKITLSQLDCLLASA